MFRRVKYKIYYNTHLIKKKQNLIFYKSYYRFLIYINIINYNNINVYFNLTFINFNLTTNKKYLNIKRNKKLHTFEIYMYILSKNKGKNKQS